MIFLWLVCKFEVNFFFFEFRDFKRFLEKNFLNFSHAFFKTLGFITWSIPCCTCSIPFSFRCDDKSYYSYNFVTSFNEIFHFGNIEMGRFKTLFRNLILVFQNSYQSLFTLLNLFVLIVHVYLVIYGGKVIQSNEF